MKNLKTTLLVIVFFAFLDTANAQQIEQEIVSFMDSEILINNGRRMMTQYVQTQNFERVAEIYHFLNERTLADNCVAFTISEELLITALIKNWDYFFTIAEYFSDIAEINLCTPIHDNSLIDALFSEVGNNISQILENALATDLTLEEIQLLELYLYLIERGTGETYRQKLRAFRRQHSQSKYNDFVRNYFPRVPVRMDVGLSIGATQVFPTGGLSNYFSSATAVNFAGDFRFNRLFFGVQFDAGGMRLSSPLLSSATNYRHDFREGDRFLYVGLSVPVGYTLIRHNRFELTPFVNFAGVTTIMSTLYSNANADNEFIVMDSFTVGIGLRTEFQFASINLNNDSINFRFDVGYNRPASFHYTPARGNLFYTRAGIVWWFGNI